MLVLSSPSGAGKSSIAHGLLAADAGLQMSVSVTTRPPRPGEIDGRDYSFMSVEAFAALADSGRLLEHAVVFGNRYGTPREPVEAALAAGSDVLFDVDWQGAQQLRASAGDDVVSVFILPPSQTELERRLRGRGQDSDDVVRARMARASAEMSHWGEYDYVVVNRELSAATAEVRAILAAERLRRRRQVGLAAFVATVSGT
ncbi:MAG: guanylate kinase [Defluviicoccus sp.]|nr:guanylate kinase [Defluviicoccus sp.]MDG4609222.1 guanylate kinase [Defluviicoccus sp.]